MAEQKVVVSMTREQLQAAAQPVLDVINKQLADGTPIDSVLFAVAYALGSSIRARGGKLRPGDTLGKSMPPIMAGYDAMDKHMGRANDAAEFYG